MDTSSVTSPTSPTLDGRTTSPAWGRLLLATAFLAPTLFVVGQALLPVLPDDLDRAFAGMAAHRDQMAAAQLLTALGAFLFVPAAAALMPLVPRGHRGATALRVGAVIFAVATFANAVSQAVETYVVRAATAPGVDPAAGRSVLSHLGEGAVGILVSFWSIPLFSLGLIVMGVAILISRRCSPWLPAVMILGTLLGGSTAGRGPIVALTMAPLIVAFGAAGWFAASASWRPGRRSDRNRGGDLGGPGTL